MFIMMQVPFFFPIWGGVVLLLAIASHAFPKTDIGKINEYLKFLLTSVGSFWVLFMIGRLVAGYRWEGLFQSERALLVLLFVWLTLTHLIYPFKKVKRDKYLTIASLALLAVVIVLTAIGWIGMTHQ